EPGLDELVLINVVRSRKYLVCFKKKDLIGNSLERLGDWVRRLERIPNNDNTIRLEMVTDGLFVAQLTLVVKLVNTKAAESNLPRFSQEIGPLAGTTPQVTYGFHDQEE
ncbi:hypothetical protein MPER_09848, partial [Moniliophthora perniciosa FA553]